MSQLSLLKKKSKTEIEFPDGLKLIETDAFPFEFLSELAQRESWRKEVFRPVYHIHKWWAKRLGSIFRGIILGCALPPNSDFEKEFYLVHNFTDLTVFDPFMGSGTTIGEAHKLGITAFGRDINPVAYENVRVALGPMDSYKLQQAFSHLENTVGRKIRALYQSKNKEGQICEVLYWFWVKQAPCPECDTYIDLFSSRVIARNAYPDRKPEIQVCCPSCGDIFSALNHQDVVCCPSCLIKFPPGLGNAKGASAICTSCSCKFPIAASIRRTSSPPKHRLYAKLLLTPEGKKVYLPATSEDIKAYLDCSGMLDKEVALGNIKLPSLKLTDGYNTRQALNYNYIEWKDFFNSRQLLALGWLQSAIAKIPESDVRAVLLNLFSGVLEFNNQFTSYKGEGTGAVRHMFAHHILKPEKTPIEANVWGTPKSSGAFSNLFRSRLLRAIEYRKAPFEVSTCKIGKTYECSKPFSGEIEDFWPAQANFKRRGIYLSCGSSDKTELPDNCVDFVVTDPPFFDNVHYSELADFFYAWESLYSQSIDNKTNTTRHSKEVQDTDADIFASKLCAVFRECNRVLKDDGLLAFTYHHSRQEGWVSLAEAIYDAGFTVFNAHPVKAEMSVATPKAQAKEPIQLDIVLVCRKSQNDSRPERCASDALAEAVQLASYKAERLNAQGLKLSVNDCRIILYSQFLVALGCINGSLKAKHALLQETDNLELALSCLYQGKVMEIGL